MTLNPIAALLGLTPAADKHLLTINGERFELYPARNGNVETMYRVNPGVGVGNPGFCIHPTQQDGKTSLGLYLTHPSGRSGQKRAMSEAVVDAAHEDLA